MYFLECSAWHQERQPGCTPLDNDSREGERERLTLQVMDVQRIHEVPPPGPAPRLGGCLQVVLGQLPGQVDEGDGQRLRLPLQAQRRAQAAGKMEFFILTLCLLSAALSKVLACHSQTSKPSERASQSLPCHLQTPERPLALNRGGAN